MQIDADRIEAFLRNDCEVRRDGTYNRTTGRRVSAILPVHALGHPVDIDRIRQIARTYRLSIVEDSAEALGAEYKGRPVGCTDSIAILSFNGNKIITTGGGGMVLTDSSEWAERVRHLSTQAKSDPLEYNHDEIGYNYRLTNVQAAIGCAQVEELEHHVQRKRLIAKLYERELSRVSGMTVMPEATWARSTFWLYTVLIDESKFGMDSRELARRLSEFGIQTRPLWRPVFLNPPYAKATVLGGEVAEKLWEDIH